MQLFRADSAHSHENSSNAVESIPDDVKNEIQRLYKNNVTKPKAIQANLLKKGFDVPPIQKRKTPLKKLVSSENFHLDKWPSFVKDIKNESQIFI